MQHAQLVSDVIDRPENRGRAELERVLRRHDQMLAAIAWVIEQTTELHADAQTLDPLYDAYDFVHELRRGIAGI